MTKQVKIAPSILSADFANLGQEVAAVSEAGAEYLHIDVMDGFFVPSLSIGPCVVGAIREYSKAIFDVHLMTAPADSLIPDFIKAGADIVTVHYEAVTHLHNTVSQIKRYGKKAGVAIIPSTPLSALEYIIEDIDLLLIMTVNPGLAGQKFIASQLRKISDAKELAMKCNPSLEISVDGGVAADNAQEIIAAGADILVSGSAIFKKGGESYKQNINNLLMRKS